MSLIRIFNKIDVIQNLLYIRVYIYICIIDQKEKEKEKVLGLTQAIPTRGNPIHIGVCIRNISFLLLSISCLLLPVLSFCLYIYIHMKILMFLYNECAILFICNKKNSGQQLHNKFVIN